MSQSKWPERDDDLDELLGSLGTPELATPETSAAEILGRAALLAPPVIGLAGWKLAATLAVAVGGGFLGGVLARGPTAGPSQEGLAPIGVTAPVSAELGSGQPEMSPEEDPECPPDDPAPGGGSRAALASGAADAQPGWGARPAPVVPESGPARMLPRDQGASTAGTSTPGASTPGGAGAPATALGRPDCPEPELVQRVTPALQAEDLAAIDAMLPAERDPQPADSPGDGSGPGAAVADRQPAPDSRDAERRRRQGRRDPADKRDESIDDDIDNSRAELGRVVTARYGAGALILTGDTTGLIGQAGVRLQPDEQTRAGLLLGADLDVALFSAQPAGRWAVGLGVEAGRAWNLKRVSLDAGWHAGGRLVLPATPNQDEAVDPANPPPRVLADEGMALVPMTGPRLGLGFGGADHGRIRVDLAAQLSPGPDDDPVQPWVSLVVGSSLPVFGKKDG